MKAKIEVEMGEKTCGECPWNRNRWCSNFRTDLAWESGDLRCPACLAKYGTGDRIDPRDAVVEAARSPCYCDYGLSYHFPGCPVGIALAALDAEGKVDISPR